MMQMQQVSQDGGGGQGMGSDQSLSQDQMEQMKRLYGFDKPHWEAYLIWLGILPRETEFRQIRFANFEYEISERVRIPDFHLAELDWNEDGYLQKGEVPGKIARYVKFNEIDRNKDGEIDAIEADQINSQVEGARERIDLRRDDGGGVELLNETELLGNWTVRMREEDESVQKSAPIAELFYDPIRRGFTGKLWAVDKIWRICSEGHC